MKSWGTPGYQTDALDERPFNATVERNKYSEKFPFKVHVENNKSSCENQN